MWLQARFHRDHERIEWKKFDSSGKYVSEREIEIDGERERERELESILAYKTAR